MAVTRNSRSITMTAQGDAITGRFHVLGITASYDGAAASSAITVTETSGAVIARHVTEAADGSAQLINAPQWLDGLIASVLPANTTLTIQTD